MSDRLIIFDATLCDAARVPGTNLTGIGKPSIDGALARPQGGV